MLAKGLQYWELATKLLFLQVFGLVWRSLHQGHLEEACVVREAELASHWVLVHTATVLDSESLSFPSLPISSPVSSPDRRKGHVSLRNGYSHLKMWTSVKSAAKRSDPEHFLSVCLHQLKVGWKESLQVGFQTTGRCVLTFGVRSERSVSDSWDFQGHIEWKFWFSSNAPYQISLVPIPSHILTKSERCAPSSPQHFTNIYRAYCVYIVVLEVIK